nr:MAG TPA_asm: hypothetical protein [Caudoviricetes sp.]
MVWDIGDTPSAGGHHTPTFHVLTPERGGHGDHTRRLAGVG